MQRKFFCEVGRRPRRRAAGRSEWIFLRIFDKVGSSEIVKILQDLTFGFLTSYFVGGARRRPRKNRKNSRKSNCGGPSGI